MTLTERFLEEINAEFPRFRVVRKRDSGFSKLIDGVLKVVTFGGQRQYMTHYHTVIANTLYVPDAWDHEADLERVCVLRHERVHLRQTRRYTMAGMTFLYLMPIFPIGLAYGRARIEWEAYEETLRATAELLGIEAARSPRLQRHIVDQFVGGSYGYMWPFRSQVEGWVREAMTQIESEARSRDTLSEA